MRNYERVDGKLKTEDIEDIVQSVAASSRLEGSIPTDDEIDMLRKCLNGDITDDEYKSWVLKHAGVIK